MKSPFSSHNKSLNNYKSGKPLPETQTITSGVLKSMAALKDPNLKEELITGKKIRPIKGVVVSAKQETADTWTLNIFVGKEDKDYLAGQFISIAPHQFAELVDFTRYFEYKKGKKEPVRAYSLTSAPHEKYVSITIKPEVFEPHPDSYPPLLSPLLASNILVGREIEFLGYAGGYIIPEDLISDTTTIVHLVAGSGIVPNYSILKDELLHNKNLHTNHKLIYVNKTVKDIIFHQELMELERQYKNRFSAYYFLTKEDVTGLSPNYIQGRPNLSTVSQLSSNVHKTLYFACGPAITKWQKKHAQQSGQEPTPRFMEWVHEVMTELNVDKKRFKREVYG